MFDLEKSEHNELTVHVRRANMDLTVYYREPDTSERIEYSKSLIRREKGKLVDHSLVTRLDFGMKIITGIPDEMFGYKNQYISSNPDSPDYREDWKDLLKASVSDVISQLAYTVFEGIEVIKTGEDKEEDEKESSPS